MDNLIAGVLLAVLIGWTSHDAMAQVQPTAAQPAAAPTQQLLKAEELDQLLAPIALYPDALLAEVLMAATYPLEVVEADRWASANKKLKGDQLKAAADNQSWDDSLKALVATPSVLTMMSSKLNWTQRLGDAVLAQQPDVMDAIQRLRSKAQAQNKLATTKEQKVSVTQEQSKNVIVIEPAVPDTVYVPYYNPAVVYGAWPYPAYPPYYFAPPPGYIAGAAIATGVAFGVGYAVGRWATGGNYWGGGVNWGGRNINVNRPININANVSKNWQHNSVHRRGVAYNNTSVQQHFGNNNIRGGSQTRLDFRGRGGDQVLRPVASGERPNIGGGGGDRPSLGDGGNRGRPGNADGDRPSLADRGKGDRPGKDGGGRANIGGGDRPSLGDRGKGDRPATATRPTRDSAFGNVQSGKLANVQADRGRASLGDRAAGGGGGARAAAQAGGGGRAGGGGGRGGGGRRR